MDVAFIQLHTFLQVVYCLVVLFQLEISQAQVVMELGIIRSNLFCSLEGLDGVLELPHLVERHSQVEEALEGGAFGSL